LTNHFKMIKFIIKKHPKFVRFFGDNLDHKHIKETQSFTTDKPTREEFVIFRERTNASFGKTFKEIISLEKMMQKLMNQAKEDFESISKEIKEVRESISKEMKEQRVSAKEDCERFSKEMKEQRASAKENFESISKEIKELQMFQSKSTALVSFVIVFVSILYHVASLFDWYKNSDKTSNNETKKIPTQRPENEKPK
jgi:hypothetical protein